MRRQDAPPWLVAAHLALLATSHASAVPTTPSLSRVSRRRELRVGAFVLLRQIAPGWRLPALRGIRTCQPAEITRPTPRTVRVEHALGYPGEYPARSALHHRRREQQRDGVQTIGVLIPTRGIVIHTARMHYLA